jgi:hypothetical protein
MNWLKDHYHYIALIFWLAMIAPTLLFWKDSVLWIAIMSLYANIWISVEVLMNREDKK